MTVEKRFKQHLWTYHHVDPQAVVVRLGSGGKVVAFGIDPNVAQNRWIGGHQTVHQEFGRHVVHTTGGQTPVSPHGVEFESGWVSQVEYDGVAGVTGNGQIPR